jgi:hypothetical protein
MSKSTRLVKTKVGPSASRRKRTVASSEVSLSPVWSEPTSPRREKMAGGREGVVAALLGAEERPGVAVEGAGDHPPDGMLALEQPAGLPAPAVELVEGDDPLVGGDLEHRVGRGVDDRLAGLQVLGAELLDDLGARGWLVAEDAAADGVGEGIDHLGREPVGIGRERLVEDDAHHLPVAGGGVLAPRALDEPAGNRRSARLRRTTL